MFLLRSMPSALPPLAFWEKQKFWKSFRRECLSKSEKLPLARYRPTQRSQSTHPALNALPFNACWQAACAVENKNSNCCVDVDVNVKTQQPQPQQQKQQQRQWIGLSSPLRQCMDVGTCVCTCVRVCGCVHVCVCVRPRLPWLTQIQL